MRKNKTRLIRFSVLALCLTLLMFGVYAVSKSATLTTSGTVGFNAHDCTLTMYGTITGAVSNIDNMLAEPNEVFYFGNEENQLEIKDTTVYSFAENLTDATLTTKYPIIYFNDAGNTVPPIVMTYHFTNTSPYAIYTEVENLISYEGTTATITSPIEDIGVGETVTMVITITLDDIESEIPTNATNFSLSMNFGKQAYSMGLEYTPNYEDGEIVSYNVSGLGTCTDTSIKIPQKYKSKPVTGIANEVFYYKTNITDIVLPNTLKYIGNSAFENCYGLKTVTFENNSQLETIGDNAFDGCTVLNKIEIPENVNSVGEAAFIGCINLDEIHIKDLGKWCGIVFDNYDSNPLYTGASLYLNNELVIDAVIPEGVTTIEKFVFYNCKSLASITLPSSLESVRNYAFSDCLNLKDVHISDLDKWCRISFNDSRSNPLFYYGYLYLNGNLVTEVTISNMTEIPKYLFIDCMSLHKVIISEGVETIGELAFSNCINLTSIVLPSTLTTVNGIQPFTFNKKLVEVVNNTSYYMQPGYTNLGYIAENAKVVTQGTEPTFVKEQGDFVYYENGDECYLLSYKGTDTEVILPSKLGDNESYKIYKQAFMENNNVLKITIPEGVTEIGDQAFRYCRNLTSIVIPSTLEVLGEYAFDGCYRLVEIINNSSKTIYLSNTKIATTGTKSLYVKTQGDYIYYENGEECYLVAYRGKETNITLPTKLGNNANYEILPNAFSQNYKLIEVTIPKTITEIPNAAFSNCESLKKITFLGDVTIIGESAFGNCTSLRAIDIPDSVTEISYRAFSNCVNLTEIIIPEGITNIAYGTFSDCTKLINLVLPASIKNIESSAFYNSNSVRILYKGTEQEFSEKVINNDSSIEYKIYYYSEDKPTTFGYYWHYVTDETTGKQVPTVW